MRRKRLLSFPAGSVRLPLAAFQERPAFSLPALSAICPPIDDVSSEETIAPSEGKYAPSEGKYAPSEGKYAPSEGKYVSWEGTIISGDRDFISGDAGQSCRKGDENEGV